MSWVIVCVCRVRTAVQLLAHAQLGKGTGRRTVTMAAQLLLTIGPVRYEAVLHSCGTSALGGMGGWYRLVTMRTHGDFIVLTHWEYDRSCFQDVKPN